ncbi:hypothetical protein G3A43_06140 [Paraburkholderia aspalathi]|nr:hypothetical protein [Paraburkholderia aspalathi]MBK3779827.1 hypothetical protein [Paraburkholderia aspalathi]
MEKCIVKGCQNHKHQGLFVGDLCTPCHRMLTTGNVRASSAWFAKELAEIRATPTTVTAALADFHAAWKKLPEVHGYSKPDFETWLGHQFRPR